MSDNPHENLNRRIKAEKLTDTIVWGLRFIERVFEDGDALSGINLGDVLADDADSLWASAAAISDVPHPSDTTKALVREMILRRWRNHDGRS